MRPPVNVCTAVEFQTSNSVIMSAGIKDTSRSKQSYTPPRASCYLSAGACCDWRFMNHRAWTLSAVMTLLINTADRWPRHLYFFISPHHLRRVLRAHPRQPADRTHSGVHSFELYWCFLGKNVGPKCPRRRYGKTKLYCNEFTSHCNAAWAFINISKLGHYDWMFASH